MRIIGLLSWFDEDPKWLTRCVESLAKIPIDHLVALDGPYGLYPSAKAVSDMDQYRAIHNALDRMDKLPRSVGGWTYVIGRKGTTEIDKRNDLFEMAEEVAEPGDWYMVIDSDEFVTEAPADLHGLLASTPLDVGAVELIEPGHGHGTIHFPTFPMFFRAIPGLRVVGNHFSYVTPDGRFLWGDAKRCRIEPRAMTGVKVEHHNQLRHPDRRAAQAYYDARDEAKLEVDIPDVRYLTASA